MMNMAVSEHILNINMMKLTALSANPTSGQRLVRVTKPLLGHVCVPSAL